MSAQRPDLSGTSDLSLRLGRRVRSARAARAMTMRQLAHESGISLPYLSRVEKGDGNISISVLSRLAAALNVTMDSLLTDHDRYGPDYTLIVEMLKRQTPAMLSEIRSGLLAQLARREVDATLPRRIALTGLRGAGKSTLGPRLADALGVPFVELNAEVARQANLSINEVFAIYGQAGFRRLERQCLEQIIASHSEVVLATGGGIVAEPATYELLLHSFFCLWLHADPDVHFRRVMAQHDVRIATDSLREEAMTNITGALEARRRLYVLAHADIDTTRLSVEQVVKHALDAVACNATQAE